MELSIVHIALIVRDYDEAIAFFVGKLGFRVVEDREIPEQGKRWVVVAPPSRPADGTSIVLARAARPEEEALVGRQASQRVFLFLRTDDFWRDYRALVDNGVTFVREPIRAPYGTVAVFLDLCGNRWDLIQYEP